jgi:energy-coupling factor transporter ATP-binding protein EcfA2
VKALAGLSFFLRHIAEKNQFLIIDEPELNLHPDNQRKVARVLARIVRSGIKVLISTHSDYIIRELNNLIMLSADKDGSVRQRLGYDEAETLSPSQVGAYLFDSEKANPIPVTPTGIEVATIEREINALNTVSQDIYFTLFGGTGG